jgi:hypothetical protein
LVLQNTAFVGWTSSDFTAASDLLLGRDAANTLALRNGTNAQALHIYNTYTDASNYERAFIGWSGNDLYIAARKAGTGSARQIIIGDGSGQGTSSIFFDAGSSGTIWFRWGGGDKWKIPSTGHLLASTDNTCDIGASGADRPRHLYLAGNVNAASLKVGGQQVVGARQGGWTGPTGTADRTAFDTATVTLAELAKRVKALIDDLTTHGLIGDPA